jgi:hypothetical protein
MSLKFQSPHDDYYLYTAADLDTKNHTILELEITGLNSLLHAFFFDPSEKHDAEFLVAGTASLKYTLQ